MSSILTNTSAMVALQTLKGINSSLGKVQSEISTGKSIASARDNAAVWAISKTMDSDVKGFNAITDSLNLGASTVGVARVAAEKVTDLLTEMKETIVKAQAENLDRTTLQQDVTDLANQIRSTVGAAQYNGLNLVNGSVTTNNVNTGSPLGINVLSSLDRSSDGTVTASYIGVNAQNLSTSAGLALTAGGALDANVLTESGGADDAVVLTGLALQAGGTGALSRTDAAADPADAAGLIEGDRMTISVGSVAGNYSVKAGDTIDSILTGLKDSLVSNGLDTNRFSLDITTSGSMTITNLSNVAGTAVEMSVTRGTGGLAALETLDVSTDIGAADALQAIEGMLQTATSAAASFGASGKRIDLQSEFVSELTDALVTGIGSLVDADMEEASARLQALQTQQQLGIQALSIANQAPQNILSLFR